MPNGTDYSALQQWKCHKIVKAGLISAITIVSNKAEDGFDSVMVHVGDKRYEVSLKWLAEKKAKIGGYFVVYDDEYVSYSPSKAFEDGYAPHDA